MSFIVKNKVLMASLNTKTCVHALFIHCYYFSHTYIPTFVPTHNVTKKRFKPGVPRFCLQEIKIYQPTILRYNNIMFNLHNPY